MILRSSLLFIVESGYSGQIYASRKIPLYQARAQDFVMGGAITSPRLIRKRIKNATEWHRLDLIIIISIRDKLHFIMLISEWFIKH